MPQYAFGLHTGTTASASCKKDYLTNDVAVYASRCEIDRNGLGKGRHCTTVQTKLRIKLLRDDYTQLSIANIVVLMMLLRDSPSVVCSADSADVRLTKLRSAEK